MDYVFGPANLNRNIQDTEVGSIFENCPNIAIWLKHMIYGVPIRDGTDDVASL